MHRTSAKSSIANIIRQVSSLFIVSSASLLSRLPINSQ
jgi:hypothetical protein